MSVTYLRRISRHACIVSASALACACSSFDYGIDVVNFGHSGVLILQLGDRRAEGLHDYYASVGVDIPILRGLHPRIPSIHRDPASATAPFQGYPHSLPEVAEIVWQLADLKDCDTETKVPHDADLPWLGPRARKYGPEEFTRKSDCTWHPLPDKVYRQHLDMRAIRNSEAYRKTGDRAKGVAGSRYTLNLTLVFIEDRLIVEVDNGATNPWL